MATEKVGWGILGVGDLRSVVYGGQVGGWEMIECGWDLKGPMPPLNTYGQTIPKYSWSAASSNTAGHCGGCTFYDYDKVPALRWRGRTTAQNTEKN